MTETGAPDDVSFAEAMRLLRAPPDVFRALVTSGLLGYTHEGRLARSSLEHFRLYGTQWQENLGLRTLGSDPYQNLPTPENIEGGAQPTGTLTEVRISHAELDDRVMDQDYGWIAQFYLKPNHFFFPDPFALTFVGPTTLKLPAAATVSGASLPTYVYPDPTGQLAMVMVIGNPKPLDNAQQMSYDVVAPILDRIALVNDQPLQIVHSVLIRIPSGALSIILPKPPPIVALAGGVLALPEIPEELRDAVALYREGISSNNPFHQFLALWKAYENAISVRSEWRKAIRASDVKLVQEVFPKVFAYGGFEGLSFDQARQKLNGPYRVALAHGSVKGGKPLTSASFTNISDVAGQVPVIRYMARIVLQNVRATLAAEEIRLEEGSPTRT